MLYLTLNYPVFMNPVFQKLTTSKFRNNRFRAELGSDLSDCNQNITEYDKFLRHIYRNTGLRCSFYMKFEILKMNLLII